MDDIAILLLSVMAGTAVYQGAKFYLLDLKWFKEHK